MADSDITQLIGTLRALDQWRTAEVTMQSRGTHRLRDGSLFLQVEYQIDAVVPNHDEAKRLLALIDGKDVAPIEERPVVGAEPLGLFDSEPGEADAGDASPGSSES